MLPAEALAKLDAMDDYDRMLAFSRFGSDYRMSAAEVERNTTLGKVEILWRHPRSLRPTQDHCSVGTICKLYPGSFKV